MNDAVEDGVGERGYPDQIVPAVDGNLADDDERALVVTILDDLQQIARRSGVSASGPQSSKSCTRPLHDHRFHRVVCWSPPADSTCHTTESRTQPALA